jgi:hypothetical protein
MGIAPEVERTGSRPGCKPASVGKFAENQQSRKKTSEALTDFLLARHSLGDGGASGSNLAFIRVIPPL